MDMDIRDIGGNNKINRTQEINSTSDGGGIEETINREKVFEDEEDKVKPVNETFASSNESYYKHSNEKKKQNVYKKENEENLKSQKNEAFLHIDVRQTVNSSGGKILISDEEALEISKEIKEALNGISLDVLKLAHQNQKIEILIKLLL